MDNGLARTAPVVTGAAVIMIIVFLCFSVSEFVTLRNFGVAQATAVFIDAFIIRLIIVPAMMKAPRRVELVDAGLAGPAAPGRHRAAGALQGLAQRRGRWLRTRRPGRRRR